MTSAPSHHRLGSILDKAFILQLRRKDHIDALFKTARELRSIYFQENVFLYGFLYISTYCRNNCEFCFYRASNREPVRYRKGLLQVEDAAAALAQSGVHLIDLTMGEDPEFFQQGFDPLVQMVETVHNSTGLPIMVSPGVVPGPVMANLAAAGAQWVACYQETHRRSLFETLRPHQDYDLRLNSKRLAHQNGLLVEEGILVGIGETPADISHTIDVMRTLEADQVRAMNFVPQKGTPMEHLTPPDPLQELLIIALLRLVFPDRLIPATLDIEGLAGLEHRLEAGANALNLVRSGLTSG